MSEKIYIFDTTLRDAEQSPGAALNRQEKLQIARHLQRLNVDVIEAGFPISSDGDFKAVQQIAEEIEGPEICALARALERDIETAWEAIMSSKRPRLHTFIGTSDMHIKGITRNTREDVLRMAVESVALARSMCNVVEFSPMDATRTNPTYLYEIVAATIEAGATIINIPDTVGYAIPDEFGRFIAEIVKRAANIQNCTLSVHCHDDLGLATANAIAAVQNGARQVECTINGLGERAGNTSLEEFVMALRTRADAIHGIHSNGQSTALVTHVKARELYPISRLVSRLMGMSVAPNKAIVGPNAFVHSSGIHQDGVLKEPATFEIIQSEDVGIPEDQEGIVLSPRSGRKAIQHLLGKLGYEVTSEQLDRIYEQFLVLADKKKGIISNDDLAVLAEMVLEGIGQLTIKSVEVIPTEGTHKAAIRVQAVGASETLWEASAKDGPVDAIFQAIKSGTGTDYRLIKYTVESVGSGEDAQARAVVRLADEDTQARGIGNDINTLKASAIAYLNAVMRAKSQKLTGQGGFNPQMIGRFEDLVRGSEYRIPCRPKRGHLLVGVKANKIAFFTAIAGWKGGSRKSSSGWTYHGVPSNGKTVTFPRYRQEKHSGRHSHGRPRFTK